MANLLLFITLLIGLCAATCTPGCTSHTRLKRRAWHTFTPTQKSSYLSAELCLMHTPARQNLTGALTLFDELAASHQSQSPYMHFVGAFLPWHRALIWAHETALRTRCNYTGAQPYWAEERDAGAFATSEILAEFGGDGVGEEGCIAAGPFANYTSSIGPGYANTPHCIQRQVNETFSALSAERFVDACMRETTWEGAWPCIENEPHAGGHGGVGRLMLDPIASPGDPLFYLHHAWLDKLWADWQAMDLPRRLTEMGGNNVQDEPSLPPQFPPRPPSIPKPTGAEGDPGNVTTLTHVLNMYGNGPNRTIGEVMDIWKGVLCYEYVEPKGEGH